MTDIEQGQIIYTSEVGKTGNQEGIPRDSSGNVIIFRDFQFFPPTPKFSGVGRCAKSEKWAH